MCFRKACAMILLNPKCFWSQWMSCWYQILWFLNPTHLPPPAQYHPTCWPLKSTKSKMANKKLDLVGLVYMYIYKVIWCYLYMYAYEFISIYIYIQYYIQCFWYLFLVKIGDEQKTSASAAADTMGARAILAKFCMVMAMTFSLFSVTTFRGNKKQTFWVQWCGS